MSCYQTALSSYGRSPDRTTLWHGLCNRGKPRTGNRKRESQTKPCYSVNVVPLQFANRSWSHDLELQLAGRGEQAESPVAPKRAYENRPLLPGSSNLGEGRGPRDSFLPGRTGAATSRVAVFCKAKHGTRCPILAVRPTPPQARRSISIGLRAFCFMTAALSIGSKPGIRCGRRKRNCLIGRGDAAR